MSMKQNSKLWTRAELSGNAALSNVQFNTPEYDADGSLYPRYIGDILNRGQNPREHKSARDWSNIDRSVTYIEHLSGAPLLDPNNPYVRPSGLSSQPRRDGFHTDDIPPPNTDSPSKSADSTDDTDASSNTAPARPPSPRSHILALLASGPNHKCDDGRLLLERRLAESRQRVQLVRSGGSLSQLVERARQDSTHTNHAGSVMPAPVSPLQPSTRRQRACHRTRPTASSAPPAAPAPAPADPDPYVSLSNGYLAANSHPAAPAGPPRSRRLSSLLAAAAQTRLSTGHAGSLAPASVPPLPITTAASAATTRATASSCSRYASQKSSDVSARLQVLFAAVRDKLVQLSAVLHYADLTPAAAPAPVGGDPIVPHRPICEFSTSPPRPRPAPRPRRSASAGPAPISAPPLTGKEAIHASRAQRARVRDLSYKDAARAGVSVACSVANFGYCRRQLQQRAHEAIAAQDQARSGWMRALLAGEASGRADEEAALRRQALLVIRHAHYRWLAGLQLQPAQFASVDVDTLTFIQQTLEVDTGSDEPETLLDSVVHSLAEARVPGQQTPLSIPPLSEALLEALCHHLELSPEVLPPLLHRHGLVPLRRDDPAIPVEEPARSAVFTERVHGIPMHYYVKGDQSVQE